MTLDRSDASYGRVLLSVCLLAALAAGLVVPAPALAGDSVTIVFVEPSEVDADSGDSFELDVVVSDHGDYNANGIDELSFDIEYDPDVFTVADVEHRSMLAAGDPDAEVVGSAEIDDETGTVSIEQEREPSGDGAIATEPAVTITVEIADDVSPTTETIDLTNGAATLVTDYPQSVFERDATVAIDGGGEQTDADADANADGDPDGVTLADDPDEGGSGDGTGGADDGSSAADDESGAGAADAGQSEVAESDDGDPIPGFAATASIVAVVAALAYALVASRS
ncbi:cohesin domain-containing protein [Natrarchaeobius oligotrophus]|uniref:Cohesin domain-containing protein n=1 Tax=Natrarchaeobius chitinivorans TaxID=1679083 RepID=A0A3N6PJ32_NATCH|nr:cohesin domain-containing protein [Natrarchaeobius chitinivorans]RQG98425.1 cohesin domain-containing protein [Natrarchaeobius chitinivorans]